MRIPEGNNYSIVIAQGYGQTLGLGLSKDMVVVFY